MLYCRVALIVFLFQRLICINLLIESSALSVNRNFKKSRFKLCKLDNLIECFSEPGMYFTAQTNGTGIPRGEEDFEQFCFNQHDFGPYCARKWLQKCSNSIYLDLVNRLFLNPLQENVKLFCDPNGSIRSNFLKITQCLINKVKLADDYRRECIRDLQASSEWTHQNGMKDKNITKFYRNTCCAYNRWERCILDKLKQNCGPFAGRSFLYMLEYNSLDSIKFICPPEAFPLDDPSKCDPEEFRAPTNYIPQGIHSNSVLSYFFSYYCPNVGFGIDKSRDF